MLFSCIDWLCSETPHLYAEIVTYYFTDYNDANPGAWDTTPENVVDGNTGTPSASNENDDYLDLTENQCAGTDLGPITAIEVRGYFENNYDANPDRTVCPEFIPYFNGTDAGDVHTPGVGNYDGTAGYPKWGSYYNHNH